MLGISRQRLHELRGAGRFPDHSLCAGPAGPLTATPVAFWPRMAKARLTVQRYPDSRQPAPRRFPIVKGLDRPPLSTGSPDPRGAAVHEPSAP